MTSLYDAAVAGDLERVILLVEQGIDKNQVGGPYLQTALAIAATNNHFATVQYLVEQGADIDKDDDMQWTPLLCASTLGHLDVTRYLLEQGANRDKTASDGYNPLHSAASNGHLETVKLLMVYGADLNARNNDGELPIDVTGVTEEVKQAIRDEPRRRMDEAPGKRATEEDRHPNTASSASTQQNAEEGEEPRNKRPRLEKGAVDEKGKVAEEDEDSEPSDEEDGN